MNNNCDIRTYMFNHVNLILNIKAYHKDPHKKWFYFGYRPDGHAPTTIMWMLPDTWFAHKGILVQVLLRCMLSVCLFCCSQTNPLIFNSISACLSAAGRCKPLQLRAGRQKQTKQFYSLMLIVLHSLCLY